jgi:archaeal flagellar protein FlaJ
MNKIVSFLQENIEKEEKIIQELMSILNNYQTANQDERGFLESTSEHLVNQLDIISDSISELANTINIDTKKVEGFQRILTSKGYVTVRKNDKMKFSKELNLTSNKKKLPEFDSEKSRMPSKFSVICAKIFRKPSKLISKSFGFLDRDLKQADMPYIVTSYISLILGITLIAFIFLIILALLLSLVFRGIFLSVLIAVLISFLFFIFLVYYPKVQASNNSKKLENEMPFALSHVAAIASSKIEPSKIFSIMANAQEYQVFSRQMKKIVNQMNIYGYNLTTSLRNVSKLSSSRKFSEFLNGMATTIISGGNITLYIREKSRDMMLDYKLARERYSVSIGMYSDIYTALLIAAPLILMLILSFMGSIGQNIGNMSISLLANLGILAIIILNVLFILFLHLTQPEI